MFQFVTGTPEGEASGLPGAVASGITFLAWSAIGGLIGTYEPAGEILTGSFALD